MKHKICNARQPQYSKAALIPESNLYSTRSSNCLSPDVHRSRAVLGEVALMVAGPTFWNSYPSYFRSAHSPMSFHSQLKTHHFQTENPS